MDNEAPTKCAHFVSFMRGGVLCSARAVPPTIAGISLIRDYTSVALSKRLVRKRRFDTRSSDLPAQLDLRVG